MNFIVFKDYKGKLMDSSEVEIPRGTPCMCINNIVMTESGKPMALRYSYNGTRHYCRNDDGKGLERGDLINLIAFEDIKHGNNCRFSDDDIEVLITKWRDYLREETMPVILFNNKFFEAEVKTLREMASDLKLL